MARRYSAHAKQFCARVSELMKADEITRNPPPDKASGATMAAWLIHTDTVMSEAIETAIKELGLPKQLQYWRGGVNSEDEDERVKRITRVGIPRPRRQIRQRQSRRARTPTPTS